MLIKRLFRWLVGSIVLVCVVILGCNLWIVQQTRDRIFKDIAAIPANETGLLLGARGGSNPFFIYRIRAAVELFRAGKIRHIIVSGDNHVTTYDEASDMRDALVREGIPDSCITLDYAGFRTLDSVVRCKEVFGQNKFTIISQGFHNQRALFIAARYGIDAVGYNAKDVPEQFSKSTLLREYFAKFKAVLDLYVFHTTPKFLGEHVDIHKR